MIDAQTDARAEAKGDNQQVEGYKSLAERVNEFQNAVPRRFHTKPTNANVGTPQKADATARRPTEVVPFHLRTDSIRRESHVKSSAEIEEEEVKKASTFKARKFSAKIANSCGDLGVPKTAPKPVTRPQVCGAACCWCDCVCVCVCVVCAPSPVTHARTPTTLQPFHFHETRPRHTDAGAGGGSADGGAVDEDEIELAVTFKAQPVNKAMLQGPLFRAKVGTRKLTQPASPCLRTKARSHTRAPVAASPAAKPFRARPVMGEAPPRAAPVQPRKLTEPKPFHLRSMDRHELYSRAQQQALEAAAEEERRAREFKARPIPAAVEDDGRAFRPAPAAAPLTEPAPFKLRSVEKHEAWQSDFVRQMEKEMEQEEQAKLFKARPAPASTFNGGFVPEKSQKRLTEFDNLKLASDRRAEQRAQFEYVAAARVCVCVCCVCVCVSLSALTIPCTACNSYEVQQRLAAAEEAKRAAAAEKAAQEEREAKEFRKKMLFKARPLPHNRPMRAKHSKKPLTVPQSPRLGKRSVENQENVAVA